MVPRVCHDDVSNRVDADACRIEELAAVLARVAEGARVHALDVQHVDAVETEIHDVKLPLLEVQKPRSKLRIRESFVYFQNIKALPVNMTDEWVRARTAEQAAPVRVQLLFPYYGTPHKSSFNRTL